MLHLAPVKRPRVHYARAVAQVAHLSGTTSQASLQRALGQTRGFVRYWATKAEDVAFHQGELGGARHTVLTEAGQLLAEELLFNELRRDPARTSVFYAAILRDRGFPVSSRYVACWICVVTIRSCVQLGVSRISPSGFLLQARQIQERE